MDTEARLKQVMDVLDQIAEDTSVPSRGGHLRP